MKQRLVVKSWEELKPIGKKSSTDVIECEPNTYYNTVMDIHFSRVNYIAEVEPIVSTLAYTFICVTRPQYRLSNKMIKRKAYKNEA